MVFAPSSKNSYNGDSFGPLLDLLDKVEELPEDERLQRWELIKEHVAEITFRILSASYVMNGNLQRL